MGHGHRYFVFEDSGELRPMTLDVHERLFNGQVSLPEYAGQRIRTALVFLRTENLRPAKIEAVECSYLQLDSNGFIDEKWRLQTMADAMGAVSEGSPPSGYLFGDVGPNVIDLGLRLSQKSGEEARKRLQAERWQPSQEDMAKISKAVLKRKNASAIR